MVLTHLLLTRFSYDAAGARADASVIRPNHTTLNPLARQRLEKRFALFETFCVPSILGQTTRDFTWIFIVDPRLEKRWRDRLREFTKPHARTRIVDYDPAQEMGRLQWLRPYIEDSATHVATTNIDDDDLVSVGFLQHVQEHLRERAARQDLPGCMVVASMDPTQWDLMAGPGAPLGYLKPWHRGSFPTFAGFTVCCKQPEYDLSVLAFEHTHGAAYFDPRITLADPTQLRIRASADRAGDDWRTWDAERHLHLVQGAHPQIVVLNHLENDQANRAFERWSTRRPVAGRSDFPGMMADFDRIPEVIRSFRRSPAALVRHIFKGLRPLVTGHSRNRLGILVRTLTAPVWFLKGLPENKR